MLNFIRRDLSLIHSSFENLSVIEKIPCICDECKKNDNPFYFEYSFISRARAKEKDELMCQNSLKDVSVKDLLSEVEQKEIYNVQSLKKLNIFLASSSELRDERREIELFIRRENRRLMNSGTFLDLVLWEDLKRSFSGDRIQEYFNQEMLKCEVVIFLFFKKTGEYTREELNVAYKNFKHRFSQNLKAS